MTWRRALVVLGAVLALVAVALIALRGGLPEVHLDVRSAVAGAGLWAPMLFVLLHGVIAATPVPRTVFTVAAGVLFGSVLGIALAVAGTAIAASGAYLLVRLLGGRVVERYAHHPAVRWVRGRLERSGLLAMVSLRLIPTVPFSVMNYASTLAGVRYPTYLLATVLGVLPGTVAIVVLGDAAVGGTPHPAMFAVSVVSGLIGFSGALFVAKRGPHPPAEPAPDPDGPT